MTPVHPDRWLSPPTRVVVEHGEVHVWRASLLAPASRIEPLFLTLSRDERERAARFHFPRDRERFIVARGVLRWILGQYLDIPAAEVRFEYGPYGKPALTADQNAAHCCFNVSHAEGVALFAVARERTVGVDIEYVREALASMDIAERFFSRDEVAALLLLPLHQRTEAFFNCWTRKEAFIKALGEGLSHPLDQFTVSLDPGRLPSLLSNQLQDDRKWSLAALSPGPGYAAALAVHGEYPTLRLWEWAT